METEIDSRIRSFRGIGHDISSSPNEDGLSVLISQIYRDADDASSDIDP